MNIRKICFTVLAFSSILAVPAQATTLKTLKYIDATNAVQFLQNDWNPADGDTHWQTVVASNMSISTDPQLLDFFGATVSGSFVIGNDPWETVSIKNNAGEQFDLRKTQEFQLLAYPQYVTTNPYVTVVLRLTMQDGSIWDQPKVMANNMWQRGVFPVQDGSFARAEWGPEGVFDLGQVVSWEFILVDLPPNNTHRIDFHAVYMKGNYDSPPDVNAAEPFSFDFSTGDGSVLFRHADWNPSDGNTDWLYHVYNQPTSYAPYGYIRAVYRYGGDPWETVSTRKEAQTYFDLTANSNGQIIALVNADSNLDPNALVMSLTMEDGSVWQQGRPLDVVSKTTLYQYTVTGDVVSPYRFSLDPNGKGWTMAAWAPPGAFDLSRVKAWELYFDNLEQGTHAVILGSVDTRAASLVQRRNIFSAVGQAQWQQLSFASDGLTAQIQSTGALGDALSIASQTAYGGLGFNLEITSSYVNAAPDAVVFRLTTSDGKVWQQAYGLPQAGRSIFRVYTSCPGTYPYMDRGNDEQRCQMILGGFYGISSADLSAKWEIILNQPSAGQQQIKVNLAPAID